MFDARATVGRGDVFESEEYRKVKFVPVGAGCGQLTRQQRRAAAMSGEREGVCAFLQQSCTARIGHSRPSRRAEAPASNVPVSSTIINADAERLNIVSPRLLPFRFSGQAPRSRGWVLETRG